MTLVDTSAWIETLRERGNAEIRAEVTLLSQKGQVALCQPVLLELFNGYQKSRDRYSIEDLVEVYPLYRCTDEIWQESLRLGQKLRSLGVTVPNMDVLIYSIARHYDLKLLAVDRQFALMDAKLR